MGKPEDGELRTQAELDFTRDAAPTILRLTADRLEANNALAKAGH